MAGMPAGWSWPTRPFVLPSNAGHGRRLVKIGRSSMGASATEPLWRPNRERIAAANLTQFMAEVGRQWGVAAGSYRDLYGWSIAQPEQFWKSVWSFCGMIADTQGEVALANPKRMPGAQFFPQARLNYAENLLRRRDETEALVFWGEDKVKRRLTYDQLYDRVSQLAQALTIMGIQPGD